MNGDLKDLSLLICLPDMDIMMQIWLIEQVWTVC